LTGDAVESGLCDADDEERMVDGEKRDDDGGEGDGAREETEKGRRCTVGSGAWCTSTCHKDIKMSRLRHDPLNK
jgi:hypothetical protein